MAKSISSNRITVILIGILISSLIMNAMFALSLGDVNAADSVSIPVSHSIVSEPASAPIPQAAKNDQYTFVLTRVTQQAPMPRTASDDTVTKTVKGIGSTKFTGFQFTEPGEYEYQLTEQPGNRGNVRYDKTVYKVTIIVTGSLDTSVVIKDPNGKKPDKASFRDIVTVTEEEFGGEELEEPLQSEIFAEGDMKKIIKGSGRYTKSTFRFTATPDKSTKALGQDREISTTVKGEGRILFPEVTITRAGTYAYTIREIATDKSNWKYDKTKYRYCFTVSVEKDANGNEQAKVSVPTITKVGDSRAQELQEAVFENEPTLKNRVVSIVKTGDPEQFMVLLVMLAAAVLALTFILAPKRRRITKCRN